MIYLKMCFTVFIIIVYLCLFHMVSSMKLSKLNIISYSLLSILGFELLGGSLVFIGVNKHYLIQKIISETTVEKTYLILVYTIIILPLTILFFNYCFNRNSTKLKYENYIKDTIVIEKSNNIIFIAIVFLSIIGFLCTVYTLCRLGSIPLVRLFLDNTNTDIERINNSRNFNGNQYIRNLGMIVLVPLLSNVAYIYMRVTKKIKWTVLFGILFIISLIVKTYDFSKSPVIYYCFNFYLIEIVLGNVKSSKKIIPYITFALVALVFFYIIVSKQPITSLFSIYIGPIGRILFTQVSTLFLHIDTFPSQHAFLNGASFSNHLSLLFPTANNIRSGKIVMGIYGGASLREGTAGVMNSLFVGEAYANWGILGAIIAPIVVGLIISIIFNIFIRTPKKPLYIILYIELLINVTTILQGGFVDFFYNIGLVIAMLVLFIIYILPKLKWGH